MGGRKRQDPSRKGLARQQEEEGQVWVDMEEIWVHGGEEGEQTGAEGGWGESPSPVEASSHEGLKVDGAGERWKEGRAQTERRREVGRRHGQMEGEAAVNGHQRGRDKGSGIGTVMGQDAPGV